MSTLTIRKTFKVAGTPTDVTSFVLSNSAGTLGVIRADTGAVVVAAGTAMTKVATGTYEYEFTVPAASLSYTAYYTITTVGGKVYHLSSTEVDLTEESVPMPELTGDLVQDTLNSLQTERLRVARGGPKPSYSVEGHKVDWTTYLRYLDARIMALRVELAQSDPWESTGIGI